MKRQDEGSGNTDSIENSLKRAKLLDVARRSPLDDYRLRALPLVVLVMLFVGIYAKGVLALAQYWRVSAYAGSDSKIFIYPKGVAPKRFVKIFQDSATS